jgi:hypothetical protein
MSLRNSKVFLISVVLIPWIVAFFCSDIAFLLRLAVEFFRPSKGTRWLFTMLLLISTGIYYGYSNSLVTFVCYSVLFFYWLYIDLKLLAKLIRKISDPTKAASE